MAMQTKIVCCYRIFKDNDYVEIYNNNYRNQIEINKNEYPDGNLGTELITFSEFTKTEITLKSDDPNAILEVECYENEDVVIVKPDETVVLTTGKDTDNGLVPGEYSIKITAYEEEYKGFYKINPASMEWEKLLLLRNYVEEIVKGISYDIYIQTHGQEGIQREADPFILEAYKYLEKNYNILINNVSNIIDKPIEDIHKEYELKPYSKAPDGKSIRWQNKKGGRYNINPILPSIYYEKHITPTINSIENKMLKKVIDRIHEIILMLDSSYNSSGEYIKNKILELQNQYENYKKEIASLKSIPNSKKAQEEAENKARSILQDKNDFINKLQAIDIYIKTINNMKNMINHYENETWLKYITNYKSTSSPSKRLLRNKNYSQIYEIYMNLNSIQIKGKDKMSYPYKKTSKLFEIYSFLIVKEILEDIGFKWISGWVMDCHDILVHNGDLLPGENITLEKDNFKIEMIYDRKVINSNEVKNTGISQLVSINSKSNKPDILINLYKDNVFKGSFIVEVKYRKKRYIYNDTADTDVIYQLKDYSAFKYYEGPKNRVLKNIVPVDKIVVLYPKQSDVCKFKDELYDFTFIEIEPANINEKPYGYSELKEEIEEFLEEYL